VANTPLASSGLLAVNLTALIELIGFLIMLAVLARWIYPVVMRIVDSRQRQIAEQLEGAEKARKQAEERLRQSEQTVDEARAEAQRIIEAGRRSGERAGQQAKERGEEEAKRIMEQARRDS
jgi:F-type H+-transporting ATPase subunit b